MTTQSYSHQPSWVRIRHVVFGIHTTTKVLCPSCGLVDKWVSGETWECKLWHRGWHGWPSVPRQTNNVPPRRRGTKPSNKATLSPLYLPRLRTWPIYQRKFDRCVWSVVLHLGRMEWNRCGYCRGSTFSLWLTSQFSFQCGRKKTDVVMAAVP